MRKRKHTFTLSSVPFKWLCPPNAKDHVKKLSHLFLGERPAGTEEVHEACGDASVDVEDERLPLLGRHLLRKRECNQLMGKSMALVVLPAVSGRTEDGIYGNTRTSLQFSWFPIATDHPQNTRNTKLSFSRPTCSTAMAKSKTLVFLKCFKA